MDEEKTEETKILEPSQFIVPACCREGREDCEHTPKRPKKIKQNIGL